MKKALITIMVLMILIITNKVFAGDWSYEFESFLKDKYVSPDGFSIHDDWVIQTGITARHVSGWYGKFWHSGSADNHFFDMENSAELGFATETNYIIGKAFQAGGLDVNFSVAFWDLGPQLKYSGEDSIDLFFTNANFSKAFEINPRQTMTPFFNVSNYTLLNSSKGNGWDFRAGVLQNINVYEGLDWSLGGDCGYDDGYIFGSPGFNGKVNTSLSWKLPLCFGKNANLVFPDVTYFFSLPDIKDQKDDWVFGIGIVIKWK